MEVNFQIKHIVIFALMNSCLSCQQKEIVPKCTSDFRKEKNKKNHTETGTKTTYYFSPYKVYIEKPGFSVYDTMHLTVFKDTIQLLDKKLFVGGIQNVLMRDLDQDQKPELYIVWYGTGSEGYGSVEVLEIGGEEIDYSELGWIQKVFFTESQVIRQVFIERDDGCCEQLGMKFIYYKLIDNRFIKIKEDKYLHPKPGK